ncbi:MAG: two-component sensor histidine kinase, partial [Cyanobacteria bacterium P01_C01_bin.72]
MALLNHKRVLRQYRNASLPVKISLPFILVFLSFWVTGATILGIIFSHKFEHKFHEQAREFSILVKREVEQELEILREKARLLSVKASIVQGTSTQNKLQLQQILIPLSAILNSDVLTIINQDKKPLLNIESSLFKTIEIDVQDINSLLITGSDIATIIDSKTSGPPVLLGTAPIKDENGIVGGILLGTALGDNFLTQLNQSIHYELIIFSDEGNVLASTLPDINASTIFSYQLNSHTATTINDKSFFAHPIILDGLFEQQFTLVLLESQQPLKQTIFAIWGIVLTVALLGASLTIILGHWIARRTAKPIQNITQVARQVVQKERFDLRT